MNKLLRISNSFLLSIEVVFAFFVLFLSLMVASGGTGGLVSLASILSPISIISLIVMMIQMIRARTHAIGKRFVYLVHAGAVVAITAAIYETFVPSMKGYNTEVPLGMFTFGIVLLPSYLHVMMIYYSKSSTTDQLSK